MAVAGRMTVARGTAESAAWEAARAASVSRTHATTQEGGARVILSSADLDCTSGMVGTVNADGSVTVECSAQYQPVVCTLAGFTTWTATEQAAARPDRGITTEE